jgi:hypothetical protein
LYVPPAARKHTKLNDNSDNLATGELVNAFQALSDQSTATGNCEESTKTSPIDDLVINSQEDASKSSSKRGPTSRTRRPDRAVYVPPRAKRSLTTPPSTISSSSSSSSNNHHQKTNPYTVVNSQRPVDVIKTQSKSIDLSENSNSSVELNLPLSELTTTTTTTTTTATTTIIPATASGILNLDSPSIVSELDTSVIKPLCDFDPHVDGNRSKRNSECLNDQIGIGIDENSTKEISRNLQQQSLSGCSESLPVSIESNCEHKKEEPVKTTIHKNQKNLNNLHKMSEKSGKKIMTIENAGGLATVDKEDKEEKELRRASQEIKKIKQTFKSDVLEIEPTEKQQKRPETLPSPEDGEDNDDWDSKFDDNGDCLDPKMITELTQAVGKVTIEKPKSDYKVYQMKQDLLKDEEFPHVLEVSNFPVEFRTQDLMMLFSPFKESGFDIKWVDDTHALAVFSSAKVAAEVLSLNHSFIKLKPLGEATIESRTKAKKCSNSLQPYRQRPETCAALARRLVTGALGVRLKTAREERENERRVLREAKERKLLAAKQREEIWEG